jgi:DNA-binding protein HU-beta
MIKRLTGSFCPSLSWVDVQHLNLKRICSSFYNVEKCFFALLFFKPFTTAACSQLASIKKEENNFVAIENRLFLLPSNFYKKITMNKAELIAKIAEDAGITKTQANTTLDSFVEAVTKTLKGGGKVTLVGFGTFSVSKRAARNGRNPQTGEVIKIKARKVARFKAGKELSAKL